MEGKTERPYFTTKDSNVTGEMAAALAAGYLVFKDSDPELAQTYLEHSKNCFRIADETRSDDDTPASADMYKRVIFMMNFFGRQTGFIWQQGNNHTLICVKRIIYRISEKKISLQSLNIPGECAGTMYNRAQPCFMQ